MRIIITGASGMVGEGVLLTVLKDPGVIEVLVLGRRPCGHRHPKLKELLHDNFFDLAPVEDRLMGYDACFFGLGVSSVGMKPDDYRRMTYDLTMELAGRLARLSPTLTFCYVTGAGTDSTERGRVFWARVKGQTENALLRLFPHAYMFRPAAMTAVPGQRNLKLLYNLLLPTLPLARLIVPRYVCSLAEVARAMLACARLHPADHVIEVADIKRLAAPTRSK